jgi:hypothetical protein
MDFPKTTSERFQAASPRIPKTTSERFQAASPRNPGTIRGLCWQPWRRVADGVRAARGGKSMITLWFRCGDAVGNNRGIE